MKKLGLLMVAIVAIMVAGPSLAVASDNDIVTSGTTIVSPYWQADANSVYTFIGITNPSIAQNVSRSITIRAIRLDGTIGGSTTLTIPLGQTVKVFIANTNHSAVNSATISGANWVSATGSGHLIIVSEYPYVPDAVGGAASILQNTNIAGILSAWGAVVIPATSTGFAMEFIGDITDSTDGSSVDAIGGI